MIHPTIKDLSKDKYNRYEIALATAKCARMITNEYTRQRQEAERQMTGNKETDKPLNTMIDKEVRDEKAVKLAIGRIYNKEYTIVHKDPAEQEKDELAILAGLNTPYPADEREADEEEADFADETAEESSEEADEAAEETADGADEATEETAEATEETDEADDAE